jgi:hypothetical protein
MSEQTMIERMAIAAYKRQGGVFGRDERSWAVSGTINHEYYRDLARDMLTAMREPTEAMMDGAADCESSLVADVYTAMIDAALAEESPAEVAHAEWHSSVPGPSVAIRVYKAMQRPDGSTTEWVDITGPKEEG